MSKRDNQGRHWRVKGSTLEAFTRDKRTNKESVKVQLPLAGTGEAHKCGGKLMRIAGLPRIMGELRFCSKCSAEVNLSRRWDEEQQR
jgi:hypothetical protein